MDSYELSQSVERHLELKRKLRCTFIEIYSLVRAHDENNSAFNESVERGFATKTSAPAGRPYLYPSTTTAQPLMAYARDSVPMMTNRSQTFLSRTYPSAETLPVASPLRKTPQSSASVDAVPTTLTSYNVIIPKARMDISSVPCTIANAIDIVPSEVQAVTQNSVASTEMCKDEKFVIKENIEISKSATEHATNIPSTTVEVLETVPDVIRESDGPATQMCGEQAVQLEQLIEDKTSLEISCMVDESAPCLEIPQTVEPPQVVSAIDCTATKEIVHQAMVEEKVSESSPEKKADWKRKFKDSLRKMPAFEATSNQVNRKSAMSYENTNENNATCEFASSPASLKIIVTPVVQEEPVAWSSSSNNKHFYQSAAYTAKSGTGAGVAAGLENVRKDIVSELSMALRSRPVVATSANAEDSFDDL